MKIVEFVMGTATEREAAARLELLLARKPRSAKERERIANKVDGLRKVMRGLVFRWIAGGGVLATALGIAAVASYPEDAVNKEESTATASVETAENYEVNFGNVKFFLEDRNVLPVSERILLFSTLQKAYNRLRGYFGDDLTRFPKPLRLPINVIKDAGSMPVDEIRSRVTMAYDKGGVPRVTEMPVFEKLELMDLSEEVLMHELFHFFLQWNDVATQAFLEGHAHTMQREFYAAEGELDPTDIGLLVDVPEIRAAVDLGLDSYIQDRRYDGGVQSFLLERLLRTRWEGLWSDYLKIDPLFLNKFYKQLRAARATAPAGSSTGEKYYSPSKSELVEMGEAVSPGFKEWFNAQPAFGDLDSHASRKSGQAVFVPGKGLLFVTNFVTHQRKMERDQLTPPFLSQMYNGQLRVVIKTGDGLVVKEILPPMNDPNIALVNLGGPILNSDCEVWIGEDRLPLIIAGR
ncbi:hypothetical protein KJ951_01955 [Patescibacteria group bacterium]|nr:hypothetical protein [Patescibacteria group bacterium]MBU1703144.1 hypothetical protein [Patescibacteria group bacterium]MBU1953641.1 hypothetical protein [Patescibacteria group bacterium]